MIQTLRAAAAAITVMTLSASVAIASVTYTDGTFTNSNWGFETFVAGSGGGSGSATQSAATGNPGSARRVTLTTGPQVGDGIYALSRFGTTVATRYEPATQGAITSLDFSIDARFVTGTFTGAGQAVYLGAKQGTTIFGVYMGVTGSTGLWTTLATTNFSPALFVHLSGPVTTFDTTASGAPIRFGFINANGNGGSPYTTTVDYDNFNLVVNNVPSPGILAGASVAGIMSVRRRRR